MKEIIIIAGPNGAGKTSFVSQYFPFEREGLVFINADEIARTIATPGMPPATLNLQAGRIMLNQVAVMVDTDREFIFETTLAALGYAQKIPIWQAKGYVVHLVYLRLPSVEHSIERVRKRVAAGGHNIPEETIRQRFGKSLKYLDEVYKPIVDEWYIWDSLDGDFVLAEAWDD